MDLIERKTRTKELSFWVSFDPATLEELPSYDGPVSLDYYGRLHPCHVVGNIKLRTHTSSAREIREALLSGFDKKVDPRLLIRRLGVAAGNLQAGYRKCLSSWFSMWYTVCSKRCTIIDIRQSCTQLHPIAPKMHPE